MASGVLFDLDGVIVDSRAAIANSLNAALEALDRPPREPAGLLRYIGWPAHSIMRDLLGEAASEELVDDAVRRFRGRLAREGEDETVLIPGMAEVLEALAERLPLVVATTKPRELAEPLLEARGVRRLFRAVFGPTLDARSRPKSETVGLALEALPDRSAPVMVGDRRFDVEAAAAHDVPCIGVLWGIGSEEELREAGAAAVVARPPELLSRLR